MTPPELMTEEETLDQAYDIFLMLAADNLDPADVLLFNLQFEERGAAELFDPAEDWEEHVGFDATSERYSEVIIGLAEEENPEGSISDIFARLLISRDKDNKFCHILWKS